MLFNSYAFIIVFLPVTLFGYWWLGSRAPRLLIYWMIGASLLFYSASGWWFLAVCLTSLAANALVAKKLIEQTSPSRRKQLVVIGVSANLIAIGIFKYVGFFADVINDLAIIAPITVPAIDLPIGISFYTFTQIAFLVDCYRQEVRSYSLPQHTLFISYFPHLVAGPILHHAHMFPQFERMNSRGLGENLAVGISVFSIGLFKKVIIADSLAPYADYVFNIAAQGGEVTAAQALLAALAFTFQLYFDFSGYCDMAAGISRMFGITLPINFDAPYRATNIIDFWRRWHITLSNFLRDYLYIPLGGNRKGPVRRYLNLLIVMLVGGFWHGAGWTFIIWGGLHGGALAMNHFAREYLNFTFIRKGPLKIVWAAGSALLTFSFVVFAWIFFRAENWAVAKKMILAIGSWPTKNGFLGLIEQFEQERYFVLSWIDVLIARFHNVVLDQGDIVSTLEQTALYQTGPSVIAPLTLAATITFLAPSCPELFRGLKVYHHFALKRCDDIVPIFEVRWQWCLLCSVLFVSGIVGLSTPSPFLYFQF